MLYEPSGIMNGPLGGHLGAVAAVKRQHSDQCLFFPSGEKKRVLITTTYEDAAVNPIKKIKWKKLRIFSG